VEKLPIKTASFVFLCILLAALSPVLRAAEREREGCVLCGMYLDLYERTRYVISFDDGTTQSTCSLACAAQIIDKNRRRLRDIKAADCLTGELIDARTAVYLEGSDVPGVMSYTSRLAFSSKDQALSFKKKHGGRIIFFDDAVRNQLRDKQ
jgi:nitrous oxide reductase accessory protein NosL